MMTRKGGSLEERLAALEREMHEIKALLGTLRMIPPHPWWEKLAGMFKDDPLFDEIIAAGQEYRRALSPHTRKWSS
jgi:hypothetical protein